MHGALRIHGPSQRDSISSWKLLEGIVLGEKALAKGRTVTHDQAKDRMARWLKNPAPCHTS